MKINYRAKIELNYSNININIKRRIPDGVFNL